MSTIEQIKELNKDVLLLKNEIKKIIIGQDEIVEKLIISLLSNGHCLIVGVPGLAKTLLVKTISEIIGLVFKRIQFTPDLMPSDIIGTEILDTNKDNNSRSFVFIKGPLFTQILLADEINRTPPKTQSALLEAMQEKEITISGNTYKLDEPFFVLATQNPIEQEGTYPLPEAQLDRFMFQLNLDYPSFNDEVAIIKATTIGEKKTVLKLNFKEKLLTYQKLIQNLDVEDNVIEFAVNLVHKTRSNHSVYGHLIRYGAGPRASQYLILAAKTLAAIKGDLLVERKHVIDVAMFVLEHRVMLSFAGEAEGYTKRSFIEKILKDSK